MTAKINAIVILTAASISVDALAAVGADEAKQLGGSVLTEWGSERAGNKEGTIPAYTGKRAPVSPSYDPKEPGNIPDPYNEKALFTITAQNVAQHADKLSEGQKELFKIYPNYRMNIYPTHRTHVYPKFILDNSMKNATACKAVDNGLKLEGCWGGVPFPIPKTGNEMMWNHAIRWVALDYGGILKTTVVTNDGQLIEQGTHTVWVTSPYFDPKQTKPWPSNTPFYLLRFDALGPARKVGEKTIINDYIDMTRRAYSYIPGQRRVKLAPDLAYDTPSPVSGGSMSMDDSYLFFGAQDRYDFKLIGKKETYIPYNSFVITDYRKCPEPVFSTKQFPNPNCIRWELHRTWVVEGTLKSGYRHINPRRTFYFDEDNPAVGTADNYDASGKLYRVLVSLPIPLPNDNAGTVSDTTYAMDLSTGRYAVMGSLGIKGQAWSVSKPIDRFMYSPEAMASEGIR